MRVIGSLFVILLLLGGVGAVVYGIARPNTVVVQPISFNHVVHLNEASLTCTHCHKDAETHQAAGLPAKDLCLDCHDIDDEQGAHLEKDKLFAYDGLPQDIPWVRVALTKPDVFFSHRRHVGAAALDCLECHHDQTTLQAPPRHARLVMTMAACIECHEQKGASRDCLACHR